VSDSLIVGTAHVKYIDRLQTGGLSVATATHVDTGTTSEYNKVIN